MNHSQKLIIEIDMSTAKQWEVVKEEARLHAEDYMNTSYGNWDRRDEIHVSTFYNQMLDYIGLNYSMTLKATT